MTTAANETQGSRIYYLDVTRALAIVLVVILHTAAPMLSLYNKNPQSWWIGNFFDAFARSSVPLFLMVSGALLLNPQKEEPLSTFFRKRFIKVLIPMIAWSIIHIFWRMYFKKEALDFPRALLSIVEAPVYYHLWFLYVLIGIYLATPILNAFIKSADKNTLKYFLWLWFFASVVPPFLGKFFTLKVGINFFVVVGYVGFFVLGYFLRHFSILSQRKWLMILTGLAAIAVTIFGTYILTLRNNGEYDNYFYGYMSPNVILFSIFVFEFFKSRTCSVDFQENTIGKKIILAISSASYSIYLMHLIVFELLSRGYGGIHINANFVNPIIGIPLTTLLIVIISTLFTLIFRKVPVIRYIFQ